MDASYTTLYQSALRPGAAQTMEQVPSPEDDSSPNMFSFRFNASSSHHQYYHKAKEEVMSPANTSFSFSDDQGAYMNQICSPKAIHQIKRASAPSANPRDHVIAERLRREKLTQKFIALSALIPNLKKLDKGSVLEDSIQYIKQLQERVKTLEELASATKTVGTSLVYVNKFQIPAHHGSSSINERLPEIKTRISDKNVLIRIHCENQDGVLLKALAEIRKLNLYITQYRSIPFGSSDLYITVVAQMDEEFDMAVTDVVKELHSYFRRSM